MIQLALIVVSVLIVVTGARGIFAGNIQFSKTKAIVGGQAAAIGAGVIVVGIAVFAAALALPYFMR